MTESVTGRLSAVNGGTGVSGLTRYPPEPKSRIGNTFKRVLDGIRGVAGAASVIGGTVLGAGGIASANSGVGTIDPLYVDLINQQIEAQQQMQLVSFESNIEKSKHETQMAAVRNIRVG